MSIQDERELRDRLQELLGGLDPHPAPVAQVVRHGKGIRMRRWITAVAGLVLIAAGAVVVPGLIQQHAPVPAAPLHYKVTVTLLGANARDGVVGQGTIDGKRWRVIVTRDMPDGCTPDPYLLTCGVTMGSSVGKREAVLDASNDASTQFMLGTVGPDVSRVVVQLSNGTNLTVRPVIADGRRWVAFATPILTIRRAVNFVGGSEYQYAVPYIDGASSQFAVWLRPDQPGLARVAKQIGSGEIDGVSWHASVDVGPWGYCVAFADGSSCFQAASTPQLLSGSSIVTSMSCGPLYTSSGHATGASSGVAAVPFGVKDVVLKFSDGSDLRMAATAVDGTRVLGYAIPGRPKVVRTLEYGVSGLLVHSGSGVGWGC